MKLKIVAFGRLKFPGYRAAADEYLKRLKPWLSSIEEIELKPIEVPDKSEATRARIQKQEAALFTEKSAARNEKPKLVLLHEKGKTLSTQEWAQWLKKNESFSEPIVLGVGGSLGFDAELLKSAGEVFSLGPQTLSHELARVVLLEQVYRALSVNRGHPYHHEG